MKSLSKNVLFLVQFALIGLGLAFLWLFLQDKLFNTEPAALAQSPTITGPLTPVNTSGSETEHVSHTIAHQGHLSFAPAVEIAQPAVVSIYTATLQESLVSTPQGLRPHLRRGYGLGSGVIVDKRGYILTNHHVIQDVDSIEIVHNDGRSAPATIIGTDPDTDLALLHVPSLSEFNELATLDFANSDNLHVGDIVLAIGNQYGIGQTVTQGIISATSAGRAANLGIATYEDFIQTDANITVGNSGGALINTNGELIGINTAQLSDINSNSRLRLPTTNSGIGFAIPSNLAKGVFTEILEHGRVIRGWLGVESGTPDAQTLELLGIEPGYKGEMIGRVYKNSPAAKSDLRPGDIITFVNDIEIGVNEGTQAMYLIASFTPGDNVRLGIRRGNQTFEIDVAIEERPQQVEE